MSNLNSIMSSFTQINRLSNLVLGSYKTAVHVRTNFLGAIQSCSYTKKSAEDKLGLDKPKRPLTPFFKFIGQMRPALLAKNPGISSKEAISWTAKHWQELDVETKSQMAKEYAKDLEDYKKIKAMYENSLTDQQKIDIKRVREEMVLAKEKRKVKAENKELGKPKKPMSSYFLFIKTRKDSFQGKNLKEFQEMVKTEWLKLSANEKAKLDKQAQDLMKQYLKELEAWELKMIGIGRSDLVRTKPLREKKAKSTHKSQ